MGRQPDLFEWAANGRKRGICSCGGARLALQQALRETLRTSKFSREEVADRMSQHLGAAITRAQLDAWTAESKQGHRFPAEYLAAFALATEDPSVLRAVVEPAGFFLSDPTERALAEIARCEQEERRVRERRRLLLRTLDERGDGK